MLKLKLFPTLVKLSATKLPEFGMPWEPGMRVIDVINREGFRGDEADVIAAIVNGEQADPEQLLSDGDHVELIVAIAGG